METIRSLLKAKYLENDIYVNTLASDDFEETLIKKYSILTHYNNVGSIFYNSDTLHIIKNKFPSYTIFM